MLWNNKQPRFGSLNLKIGSKIRYRPTPAGHDPGFPLVLRQKIFRKFQKLIFKSFKLFLPMANRAFYDRSMSNTIVIQLECDKYLHNDSQKYIHTVQIHYRTTQMTRKI